MRVTPVCAVLVAALACEAPNPAYQRAARPAARDAGSAVDGRAKAPPDGVAPDARPGVTPPSSGLVLHFPMDEGSGTQIKDVSGAGHVANLASASAWGPG